MPEIEDYLRKGENSLVAFESKQVPLNSLAKAIVAFANMTGHAIYVISLQDPWGMAIRMIACSPRLEIRGVVGPVGRLRYMAAWKVT